MKLSDYVVSFFEQKGIKNIFMLSGGGCIHLVDSFGKSNINYICNLHEQAAAICAEAYAQYTNAPSVCLVTTGPGGTNALTGVASAWLDSIPMVIISGQVQRKDMKQNKAVRQIGFQEIDIVSIVKPITKYATTVTDPSEIKFTLEKAYHLASTGRQGPVWIDIPLDVQSAHIDENAIDEYKPMWWDQAPVHADEEIKLKVSQVYDLISNSKRPVILAGNGIRSAKAQSQFKKLIELLNIPVLTTWKAIDFLDENHPLFVGRPGIAAQRGANFSQQNSDLFISIGARLDHGQTAYNHINFAREAKKVIVDIDVAEIDKMQFDVDCQVVGDALGFINEMIAQKDGNDQSDFSWWLKKCKDWQHKYSVILPEYWEQDIGVNNYVLIDVLSDLMSSNDLLIPGSSGACSEVTMQAFRTKAGQRIFNSEGLGSMGFGIPAAIGGCVASGSKHTVCIDGDGGFVMNVQELETVRRLNLPIKFFVLNNGGYVSIRNTQNKHFELLVASGKTSGVTLPSIEKIAHSYNIEYCKVESHNNVRNNIQNVLESNGPVICEIMMLETHATMPRTSTYKDSDGNFVSAPMEDLYPFLPRDEFKENMIVKCVDE